MRGCRRRRLVDGGSVWRADEGVGEHLLAVVQWPRVLRGDAGDIEAPQETRPHQSHLKDVQATDRPNCEQHPASAD